ncbi:MAG: oligopeptide:H+ symporter, partial [Alphaproteobacteria bacterium]|nr:oligopeptide:H+ symporter [Alphaproteobacteria bacterium]
KIQAQMMTAAVVMILFNVIFMTLFEQAGSSLTLFAQRNTDLSVFGLFTLNAGQTQLLNSLFVVLLSPVFALMWTALHKRSLEPTTPFKFGLGVLGAGLGFLFLVWGSQFHDANYQVGFWWLAGLYLIHTIAELCIQPVGLSMISKLSMPKVLGLMFGLWFLSIAVAEFVAGILAALASVKTVGGEVTNLKVSLDTYTVSFTHVGLFAVGAGVVLLILSPLIRRLMHDIK